MVKFGHDWGAIEEKELFTSKHTNADDHNNLLGEG